MTRLEKHVIVGLKSGSVGKQFYFALPHWKSVDFQTVRNSAEFQLWRLLWGDCANPEFEVTCNMLMDSVNRKFVQGPDFHTEFTRYRSSSEISGMPTTNTRIRPRAA